MINIFETSFEARERRFQIEKLYHGETVDLVGVVTTNGVPQNITGYSVSGVFQPTSMNGSPDFYELSADIVENKVIVHWEKGKDFGENSYMVWALLTDGDNASYPIAWRLDMAYSPSFPLSALDPIPKAIDFSKYELINAPWAMLSDFQDFQEEVSETYATKNEVAEGLAALSDEYEPVGAEERAKQYTDEKASKYLPLSGGTMGGNIIVQPTKYFETREDDGNDGYYSIRYTGTTIDTRGSSLNGILHFPNGSGTLALEENVQQSIDALSDEYVTKVELTASYPTRNQVARALDDLSNDYEPKGAEDRAKDYTDGKVAEVGGALSNYLPLSGGTMTGRLNVTHLLSTWNLEAPGINALEDIVNIKADYLSAKNDFSVKKSIVFSDNSTLSSAADLARTSDIPEIPTDLSAFTNSPGYLTAHQSLSDYYTKEEADGKFLTAHQDLTDYATKEFVQSEISDFITEDALTGLATKEELTAYAQLSDVPVLPDDLVHEDELSDYAKLSDVPEIDLSQMSACLSSAEFADESYLPADPFGELDVNSVSLVDLGNKLNKVIQLLKRDSEISGDGDPTKTYVKYEDGTMSVLTITGELDANSIPNKTNAVKVKIGNSVTSIKGNNGNYSQGAFNDCSKMVRIDIPSSVTNIGGYAFRNCSSLTSITIPNGVTSIGEHTFCDCSRLSEIVLPSSMTSIGARTFMSATGLTSITIPNSVTSIGTAAFNGCSSLTSVTIPSSVTSIGMSTFFGCSSLTSVTIPSSVTSIGMMSFVSSPATVTFEGRTTSEVQAMSNFRWNIGTDKIVCTDGTL